MPSTPSSTTNASVAQLIEPLQLASLSWLGLRTVSATRLLAVCSRSGSDPLIELARRFGNCASARTYLEFAELVATFWPEDVQVMRPCCSLLSPDEMTIARMADHAASGDRAGFSAMLEGFVRADRHDPLYERTTEMVAHMQ